LVAAAYLIMKQRRRRLARSEATEMEIGRVNSQNEHENSLHSGRAEMHDATPRTILSEGVPVREPLPVQMPGETISWQDDVEGFRVSANHPFKVSRTETILQFETED